MLAVTVGIDEERCREIANDVAFQLACKSTFFKGAPSEDGVRREMSEHEFESFKRAHVQDPKGTLEFFHRCIFAAFDVDQSGELDPDELDDFLDIFYQADSIFKGDARLPEKAS